MGHQRRLFVVLCILSSTWASVVPNLKEETLSNKESLKSSNAIENVVEANKAPVQINSGTLVPVVAPIEVVSPNAENNIVDKTSEKLKTKEENTRRKKPLGSNINTTATTGNNNDKPKPGKPNHDNPKPSSADTNGKPNKPNAINIMNNNKPQSHKPHKPTHFPGNLAAVTADAEEINVMNNNKPQSHKPNAKPKPPHFAGILAAATTDAENIPVSSDITEIQQEPVNKGIQQQLLASIENSQSNQILNSHPEPTKTLQQSSLPEIPGELPSPPKGNGTDDDKNVVIVAHVPQIVSNKPTILGIPVVWQGLFKPKGNANENTVDKENSSSNPEISSASKIEAQIQQIKYQMIQALNSSTNSLLASATEKSVVDIDSAKPETTSDNDNKQGSLTDEQVKSILTAFANHTQAIKLSLQQNLNSTQTQSEIPVETISNASPEVVQITNAAKENENEVNKVSSSEQLESQQSAVTVPVENLAKPEIYYEVEEIIDEPTAGNTNPSLEAIQPTAGNANVNPSLETVEPLASGNGGKPSQPSLPTGNAQSQPHLPPPILSMILSLSSVLAQAQAHTHYQPAVQEQPQYPLPNNGNFDLNNIQPQQQQINAHVNSAILQIMQTLLPSILQHSSSQSQINVNVPSGSPSISLAAVSSPVDHTLLPSGETAYVVSASSVMGLSPNFGMSNGSNLHPSSSNILLSGAHPAHLPEMHPDSVVVSNQPNPTIIETESRPAELSVEENNNPSPIALTTTSEEDTFAEEVQTVSVDTMEKEKKNTVSVEKMHRPNYNNNAPVVGINKPLNENELFGDRDNQNNKPGKPSGNSAQSISLSSSNGKPEKPNSSHAHGKPQQSSQSGILIHNDENSHNSKPTHISHLLSGNKPHKPNRPSINQNSQVQQVSQNFIPSSVAVETPSFIKPHGKPSRPHNSHNEQNAQNFTAPSEENMVVDKFEKPSKPGNSQLQQNSQSLATQSGGNIMNDNKTEGQQNNVENVHENLVAESQETVSSLTIGTEKPHAEITTPENMETVVQVQVVTSHPRPGGGKGKPHRPQGETANLEESKPHGIGKPHDKPGKGKHPTSASVKIEENADAQNPLQSDVKNFQQESGNPQESNPDAGVGTEQSEQDNRVVTEGNTNQDAKPTEVTKVNSTSASKPATVSKPSKPSTNKKPKPNAHKPKPQFGFGFGKRKPANKVSNISVDEDGVIEQQKPKPTIWQLPKWPSFAQLYQNFFGARQRTDGDEENEGDTCVPPTVNLRDKQDERPLCGADPAKDGFTCQKLCKDGGFNVGTCLEDHSCICSYAESLEAGLRMEYYYDRNTTNWEDYYPSYDSCSRCSCSNLCTETGYFLGICANTCYCARPFHNGVPLELFTSPEPES